MITLDTINISNSVAQTVVSFIDLINRRKEKKEQINQEAKKEHFEFYKYIVLQLSDYFVKIDYSNYHNELEGNHELQSEYALNGLEVMTTLTQELINSDYYLNMDSEFRGVILELFIQSKRDIIYYKDYYDEDEAIDPSQEIIDSIIQFYLKAVEEITQ